MAEEQLRNAALEYHEFPTPGRVSIAPTKALANLRDLALAYSPGVAYACTAIQENSNEAARYTSRANLVAVVTNGTAVLGLGNIGALGVATVVVGKWCGELDEARMRRVLENETPDDTQEPEKVLDSVETHMPASTS
jgi:malate dehydrogenase (oxaloacetate-decarboxylating)(NADP+)